MQTTLLTTIKVLVYTWVHTLNSIKIDIRIKWYIAQLNLRSVTLHTHTHTHTESRSIATQTFLSPYPLRH